MIEELADFCVLVLDQLDGDADLEPYLAGSPPPDTSLPVDCECDAADDEFSLGSFDQMINQENWSKRTVVTWVDHDAELDDGDAEDGGDDEDEPGDDYGDNGIGDQDGLDEQIGRFGNGPWYLPADAVAVADARKRLGAILDRVGGRP